MNLYITDLEVPCITQYFGISLKHLINAWFNKQNDDHSFLACGEYFLTVRTTQTCKTHNTQCITDTQCLITLLVIGAWCKSTVLLMQTNQKILSRKIKKTLWWEHDLNLLWASLLLLSACSFPVSLQINMPHTHLPKGVGWMYSVCVQCTYVKPGSDCSKILTS